MTATVTITTLTYVLSVVTFFLAIAALVATATTEDRGLRRLARLRVACALSAALVVAASLVNLASGYALPAGCLAFLLSAYSIWLARRHAPPLQSYLDRLAGGGDAAWRDEFERPFHEYVRKKRAAHADTRPHGRR